jgi:hypothetical protein
VPGQAEKKEQHKHKENNPDNSDCGASNAEKLKRHGNHSNYEKCHRHSQQKELLSFAPSSRR